MISCYSHVKSHAYGRRGTGGPQANLLSGRPKPEIDPLEVLHTDFTELRYADGARKAWLIPLPDHAAKYVAGFAVGGHFRSLSRAGRSRSPSQ